MSTTTASTASISSTSSSSSSLSSLSSSSSSSSSIDVKIEEAKKEAEACEKKFAECKDEDKAVYRKKWDLALDVYAELRSQKKQEQVKKSEPDKDVLQKILDSNTQILRALAPQSKKKKRTFSGCDSATYRELYARLSLISVTHSSAISLTVPSTFPEVKTFKWGDSDEDKKKDEYLEFVLNAVKTTMPTEAQLCFPPSKENLCTEVLPIDLVGEGGYLFLSLKAGFVADSCGVIWEVKTPSILKQKNQQCLRQAVLQLLAVDVVSSFLPVVFLSDLVDNTRVLFLNGNEVHYAPISLQSALYLTSCISLGMCEKRVPVKIPFSQAKLSTAVNLKGLLPIVEEEPLKKSRSFSEYSLSSNSSSSSSSSSSLSSSSSSSSSSLSSSSLSFQDALPDRADQQMVLFQLIRRAFPSHDDVGNFFSRPMTREVQFSMYG
eukprot:TRINITY_DN58_c0_g1_i2.p1 TRINITY_DN58_c0_g1~~TRINITY_DN58_c0_g1_i2.p1  ORF type:complete len:435 (+),score=129.35 TRINITY_DN58_c0_g1_i2:86-1390(+)